MYLLSWPLILINCLLATICPGQSPVQWQFASEQVGGNEALVVITAKVAPGWHLCSQYIAEGGPLPTRISLDSSAHFKSVGQMQEKGTPVTYRDETYEMEVTWYSDSVSFVQKIAMNRPATIVKVTIEYMTCNNYSCVPDKRSFTIEVQSKK